VFNQPSSSPTKPLWKRIAAFLSFVAVLSALVAPAAILAEDVRTGKLGGVCLVNTAANPAVDGSSDVTPTDPHCDMCGSLALVLSLFDAQAIPSDPSQQVAGIDLLFDLAARISGLPPSRGPPVL
jgi:hypothetical protein